ncbi:MAG: pyridoxamine 5'-phosphate oxidase [Rickettsiales bacterium]|jgi:pyridoxamine 5'-phosphate oxidase
MPQKATQNPIDKFSEWLEKAKNTTAIVEPTAMSLATADANGSPSVRIVLLKNFNENGFVFYTNLESRKSAELKQNPKAALCFYWMSLERQIRIEGKIEKVSDEEADAYFATRGRDSQIGAWSSKQSQVLPQKVDLLQNISDNIARFENNPVLRPPFWSGWRLVPNRIEFWQQGDFRLHERELFTISGKNWETASLYP